MLVDVAMQIGINYGIGEATFNGPSIWVDNFEVEKIIKKGMFTTSSNKCTTCQCRSATKNNDIVKNLQSLNEVVKEFISKRGIIPSKKF